MRFKSFLLLSFFAFTAPSYGEAEWGWSALDNSRYKNLFLDILARVKKEYVEEVSDKELIEAALNGMLSSLDPHSSYMNSEHFREVHSKLKGEFGGLGIEIIPEHGLLKVVSPIDDTPAFRAGIQPGDIIIGINDQNVSGMTIDEAIETIKGPLNESVKLTIRRPNQEPFDKIIKRETIKVQPVKWQIEGQIAYIRVTTFNEMTTQNLEEAIKAIKEILGPNLKGLILDLRNNPGGLFEQAITVADFFLNGGDIASIRERNLKPQQIFKAHPGESMPGVAIIVLINSGTASSAEIVAGALQDHKRAIVMGTPSFGKGSIQTLIPIPGHGALRLTTGRYYTPNGKAIQAKGIQPDILVEPARIELLNDSILLREKDIKGALKNPEPAPETTPSLLEKFGYKGEEKDLKEKIDPLFDTLKDKDYQLMRAFDLLKSLSIYQTPIKEKK